MKKFFSVLFNVLILVGVLLVSVDAFVYQYNARKREAVRCEHIRRLTIDIMLYSHNEERVLKNAKEVFDMVETPESFDWNLGENIKGDKK